jgi:hypothetical protein
MGATAPIHRGPPKAEGVQSAGKEHAAEQEQPLRDEGDGSVDRRAAHKNDHGP